MAGDDDDIVIYETDEWSAVYLNGTLQRVGDSYLADEWVREHFGVETRQSDDFLRGGTSRSDVAPTLDELYVYATRQERRRTRAEDMRVRARELLQEADALEGGHRD